MDLGTGISEPAGETQKVVDCLTHDFELKVKSSSDESASNESVSDHVNVIHHPDNDDEMDEHLKDQTTDSDDEEDDEMDEDDKVCQICMKEDHLTGKCPFRRHIPDPRNTKLGPRFIIICKCCHRHNVHSDDDDEWEGQAVFDPLQMIFVRDASDDSCGITDIRQVQTARSVINENLGNPRH